MVNLKKKKITENTFQSRCMRNDHDKTRVATNVMYYRRTDTETDDRIYEYNVDVRTVNCWQKKKNHIFTLYELRQNDKYEHTKLLETTNTVAHNNENFLLTNDNESNTIIFTCSVNLEYLCFQWKTILRKFKYCALYIFFYYIIQCLTHFITRTYNFVADHIMYI